MNLGYNDFEGNFTWSANLNLSTTENGVKSLGLIEEITGCGFEGANILRIIDGDPMFYFFGLKSDGINQAEVDADI